MDSLSRKLKETLRTAELREAGILESAWSLDRKVREDESKLGQLAQTHARLPACPIGDGQRRLWRFRLSDRAKAMEQRMVQGKVTNRMGLRKPRPIR